MRLFSNNIVPYASTEGDKIYPIVVDIKKGIKSGEAISFVTADNQVGVITVDFMDGNSSYSIEGCMVTSTIRRPDGTVLEIPCDIISQSTIEIPLGINGTYQEGVHTFDLKIVRGNGKIIGVPTMSYSVSGSLSSDDVVEGDDRLPVLTMVLDNAQDKLTRLDKAIAGATNDLEVKEARDGEVTLNARLERDLIKGKVHFVDVEGSIIATDSQEGYLENVEIYGNTYQDTNNLADIRSVGIKVEGQELYEIPVLSRGKNLFDISSKPFAISDGCYVENGTVYAYSDTKTYSGVNYRVYGIKELTKYTLQCSGINRGQIEIRPTTIDGTTIGGGSYTVHTSPNTSNPVSITTPVGTKGLSITFNNQIILNTKFDFKDIILVEGDECTYEPYQEDKLTILSPTPLEKVGDITDRIICKDGVWGVEKNIDEVYISDKLITNEPTSKGSVGLKLAYVTYKDLGLNGYSYIIPLSNKFKRLTGDEYVAGSTVGIYGTGGNFDFVLPTSCDTLEKAKNLINGTIVRYATNTPQFIPLPHSQQIKLRTFAGITNIHFETEIEGTIKAQVPKSLGATVNTHTTQIDNLNKELDRVKKLEESTVSTVTSDKAFTTVAETTQGYFEDVKIEGKTLVNLNDKFVYPITNWSIGGNWAHTVYTQFPNIREGVTYTAIIYGNVSNVSRIRLGHANDASVTQVDMQLNTPVSFIGKAIDSRGITLISQKTVTERHTMEELESLKLLILEGDHTDKDITFFEGLKSVGQNTDEISVLSHYPNGNLIDFKPFTSKAGIGESVKGFKAYFPKGTTKLRYKFILDNGDELIDYNNISIAFRDANDNVLSSKYMNSNGVFEFSDMTLDKCTNISFYYNSSFGAKTISKVYFYKHDVELSEIKQDKKQILYYNPSTQTWEKPVLREWDSIEKHSDGKYYYHKRSYEVMLDGSENWDNSKNASTTYRQSITYNSINIPNSTYDAATSSNLISDLLPSVRFSNMYNHNSIGISIYGTDNIGTHIAINNNFENETKLKQWLQANPVTVVYELAQEEVYECTNLDLITYSGETNLIVNSGAIQPRITLKVLSNVSNVIKLLQEKVSVLENKFIEGLKQVLSGDMMSLAQLLYPEDFENNHEIQTLEL